MDALDDICPSFGAILRATATAVTLVGIVSSPVAAQSNPSAAVSQTSAEMRPPLEGQAAGAERWASGNPPIHCESPARAPLRRSAHGFQSEFDMAAARFAERSICGDIIGETPRNELFSDQPELLAPGPFSSLAPFSSEVNAPLGEEKSLRGALRTGLKWAAGGAILGFGMEILDPHGEIADVWPTLLAIPGFFAGLAYYVAR